MPGRGSYSRPPRYCFPLSIHNNTEIEFSQAGGPLVIADCVSTGQTTQTAEQTLMFNCVMILTIRTCQIALLCALNQVVMLTAV